jgi:hypothetical protein
VLEKSKQRVINSTLKQGIKSGVNRVINSTLKPGIDSGAPDNSVYT